MLLLKADCRHVCFSLIHFWLLPLLLWDHLSSPLRLPSLILAGLSVEKSKEFIWGCSFRKCALDFQMVRAKVLYLVSVLLKLCKKKHSKDKCPSVRREMKELIKKQGELERMLRNTSCTQINCPLKLFCCLIVILWVLSLTISSSFSFQWDTEMFSWFVGNMSQSVFPHTLPLHFSLRKCHAWWVTDDNKVWHQIQSISFSPDSIMCKTSSVQRCMSNPTVLILPSQRYIISLPAAKQQKKQMQYQIWQAALTNPLPSCQSCLWGGRGQDVSHGCWKINALYLHISIHKHWHDDLIVSQWYKFALCFTLSSIV